MKIQDLRIGNKVHFNGKHKEVGTVTGIAKDEFGLDLVYLNGRIDNYYLMKHIEGIDITEEILISCGYWRHEKEFFTNQESIIIWLPAYGFFGYQLAAHKHRVFKTFHELQNLHYAIKNQELEFKK